MAYITFDEYKELTAAANDNVDKFNVNLSKASAVIDNITNNFYQFNDLETDKVKFRADRFKLALCAQVDYFIEVGGNTYEGINKAPQSFSLGRTSISSGNRYSESGSNESKSLVADDVYIYLDGTGLLYKGVSVCR